MSRAGAAGVDSARRVPSSEKTALCVLQGGVMRAREDWPLVLGSWVSVGVIAVIDYVTGYELGFFVFYFLPIGLGAWGGGRQGGLALALACAVVWLVIDITTGHPYSSPWYRYENALIRYVAFCVVALLVARMHTLFRQERALTASLTCTLAEVKELQGLLPICAACKKIRNDHGYWEHIESYLTQHSKAEFSHGMCPECAQRLYPEFYQPGG
jgi:hypothetical protein